MKNSMATPTSIVNSVSHKTVQVSVNLITEYKTKIYTTVTNQLTQIGSHNVDYRILVVDKYSLVLNCKVCRFKRISLKFFNSAIQKKLSQK